jgi:Tfp pilus assembly pilus retraction ATPase PilT
MSNSELMAALAKVIDAELNNDKTGSARTMGFCLMVFPFRTPGVVSYISNTKRDQVSELMKQQLRDFEQEKADNR